jgi:hypothetical protein
VRRLSITSKRPVEPPCQGNGSNGPSEESNIMFRTPHIPDRRIAVNPSRAKFDLTCAILGAFVAMLPIAAVAVAWEMVS